MVRCSRRLVIGIALGGCGCSRVWSPMEDIATGPLPGSSELFASAKLQALRFHRRNEHPSKARIVEAWSDANFVVNATAVVRCEYTRGAGVPGNLRLHAVSCDLRCPITAAGNEIALAFIAPFSRRAPQLARRVGESFRNLTAAGILARRQAFQADQIVGAVNLAYYQAREANFATMAFYEKHYYEERMQVPGAPVPEQVAR